MSAGTVTVGGVLSATAMSNVVLAGPAVSVVVHVTVVVPTGNRWGDAGAQVTGRSALFDGSVPVTVYETVAPPSSPATTDWLVFPPQTTSPVSVPDPAPASTSDV